jgi:hypothetical protein
MSAFVDLIGWQGLRFVDRTGEVDGPEVYHIYPDAKFLVRGLTGVELARAREHVALAATVKEDGMDKNRQLLVALQQLISYPGEDAPLSHIMDLQLVTLGAVEPKIDKFLSVQLATNFPTLHSRLAEKIKELTGLGRVSQGELMQCGKTPES